MPNQIRLALAALVLLFAPLVTAGSDVIADEVWQRAGRDQETPEQLKARASLISEAIHQQTNTPEQAAVIATIWGGEARFARDVHNGEPGKYGSDGGRAKCMWQIHINKNIPREKWEKLGGLDLASTRRCAWATLLIFQGKMRYCEKGIVWTEEAVARSMQAYASGTCVKPQKRALRRGRKWAELRYRLSQ